MSGRIIKPRVMTVEEMEAEIKAEEKALMETPSAETQETPPVAEPKKEEPPKETPPKEESPNVETPVVVEPPTVPTPSELDTLKAQLAEKDARLAEFTKRLRDEDGKRGGELATLRSQVENLSSNVQTLIAENRELRLNPPKPATPPEPDPLEAEYPEVAKGMDRRTRPAIEAAQRAEREAKEAKEELRKMQETQRQREYSSFLASVKSAVPKLDEHNSNPEFLEWCNGRNPGSPYTRQQILDACSANMTSGPVVELFQQWEKEKTPVVIKTPEPSKGPEKPTKEGQLEVPKSSAPVTKPKGELDIDKKIAQIEQKVLHGKGPSTNDDWLEYNRLLDLKAKELATA